MLHRDGSGTHGVLTAYSTLFDCSPQIDRDGSGDVEYDEFLRGFEAWQVPPGRACGCTRERHAVRTLGTAALLGPHSAAYIGRMRARVPIPLKRRRPRECCADLHAQARLLHCAGTAVDRRHLSYA